MAISLHSSTAWASDDNYDNSVTSPAFSPPAGSLVLIVAHHYRYDTSVTPTNSGTGLSWILYADRVHTASSRVQVWAADNASAQSNITATLSLSSAYPSIKVYVLEGTAAAAAYAALGASASGGGQTGDPQTIPTSTTNSTASDSWLFAVALDGASKGDPTSSDLTYDSTVGYPDIVAGYKTLGAAPESMTASVATPGVSPNWQWVVLEIKPGSQTHSASAAPSFTASRTAAASLEAVVGASRSTTATATAEASLGRSADASAAVSATLAAAATLDLAATGALSATASLTAAADVSNPNATASLASTATVTAAAAVETLAGASLAVSAAVSAAADLAAEQDAAAARVVTVTISASAAVLTGGVGDPGVMSLADIARATMKPAGSTGATMRTVLVGFNTATMQAVLDDAASLPLLGVPVFVGDDDPVTLGLIALSSPHVWFHDGTVTVREG